MTRKHIVIPSGGRIDSDYLEALSEEMADLVMPKATHARLQD
jgi:hypothetical protein